MPKYDAFCCRGTVPKTPPSASFTYGIVTVMGCLAGVLFRMALYYSQIFNNYR
jgi:hypothetical protein